MDFVGTLLYSREIDGGHECLFVTASADLFSTDLYALLTASIGEIPGILETLADVLQNALQGIANGYSARLTDGLSYIPETIEQNAQLTRIAYLQGGTTQYWSAPENLKLSEVRGSVGTTAGFLSDIYSLSVLGFRVLTAVYVPEEIEEIDYTPVDPLTHRRLVTPYGVAYFPRAETYSPDIIEIASWGDFGGLYSSEMRLDYWTLLIPEIATEGSYFHPDATLSFSLEIMESGQILSYLSDFGYDFDTPFSASHPSAELLSQRGVEREFGTRARCIVGEVGGVGFGGITIVSGGSLIIRPLLSRAGGGILPLSIVAGLVVAAGVSGVKDWLKNKNR